MCKYCKRLKELNDLDKKTYQKIIDSLKLRNHRAEQLFFDVLNFAHIIQCSLSFGEQVELDRLRFCIQDWLEKNWIGK